MIGALALFGQFVWVVAYAHQNSWDAAATLPLPRCDNFLYGFKGAPPARQAPGLSPDHEHAASRGMRDRGGHYRQALSGNGGATVRLRGGGHVAPFRAEALTGAPPPPGQPPRFRQAGGTRRNAASMAARPQTGP